MYDVRAREWSPELAVFVSADEFQYLTTRGTLWGWPLGNPVRWRDPSGQGPTGWAWGASIGGALGGWIGFDVGGAGGAVLGIPTGPGEIVTIPAGAVGGAALGIGIGVGVGGIVGSSVEDLIDDITKAPPLTFSPHKKGKRKSTADKHTRRRSDDPEKADEDRRQPRKRPKGWKGKWPPDEDLGVIVPFDSSDEECE